MASPEYSQISDDDFNRSLMGNRTTQVAPETAQVVQVVEPAQGAVKPPTRPANTSSVPNAAAPPSKAGDIDLTGMVNQVTNATTQMQKDMPAPKPADSSQHIMDLVAKHWQIPAAVIGTLATGALLNKFMGGEKTSAPPLGRVDPLMDVSRQGPIEPSMEGEKPSIKSRNFAPTYSPEDQALLERSEANRVAKEQEAARRAAAAPPASIPEPPAFIRNQPPALESPVNAQNSMNRARDMQGFTGAGTPNQDLLDAMKERQALPPVVPTSEAPPAVTETETPKEKPAKKTGRPAASTLEPTTFRPDLGPGDNWLYNTAGADRRRAILAEFNEGKPAKDYKTAQELYKKYQEKYPKDMFGPVIPVEQAKARGIKPPENYGALGKVAKVGGIAGLALTAAELANAAQQSKKGNDAPLRETIFNLLGMVPGLGTAFTAGTYTGGTNEGEMEELARRRQMAPEITRR